MINLSNYVVEKLNVNKINLSSLEKFDKITVQIPSYAPYEEDTWEDEWTEFNVPDAKYFVYQDNYRNAPHIASFNDMVMTISMFNDAYEDFTPDKIILYASNDEVDVVKWALKNILNMTDKDINISNAEDFVDNFYENNKSNKLIDSPWFIYEVLHNEDHIDEMDNAQFDKEKKYGEITAKTIIKVLEV